MLASTGNLVAIVEKYRGVRHFDDLAGHVEWLPASRTRICGHTRMSLTAVKAGTCRRVSAPCLVAFSRWLMPGTVLERAFYRARAWGLMPKLGIIFLTRRRLLAGWSEYEVLMKTPLRVSMFWRIPTARHAEPGRSVAHGEAAHG
jgi:hypothetical protein